MAENYAAQALAGRRHALGSEHPDTMASAADLALAYLSQGKFAESEPLAREAMEIDRKKQPDDWQRFRAESLLGASLAGQKKYAEAEPLLLEGYQGMVARKDRIDVPDWYHLDRAREWLVQLYQAWGKPGKAAEFEIQEQGRKILAYPSTHTKYQGSDSQVSRNKARGPWPILSLNLDRANGMIACVSTRRSIARDLDANPEA